MKLVASMPVYNEMDRGLELAVGMLMNCCDEIRVLDDGSTDDSYKFLKAHPSVSVTRNNLVSWRHNEGQFRQALIDWTLKAQPTHILSIDADEIIPESGDLRDIIEHSPGVQSFSFRMCEVWKTRTQPWTIRWDGGWVPHDVPLVWCPDDNPNHMAMPDKKMACGRMPAALAMVSSQRTGLDILHLGWVDETDRMRRHKRYVELDGGNFHAASHLDSILWSDDRCDLRDYEHPLDDDLARAVSYQQNGVPVA